MLDAKETKKHSPFTHLSSGTNQSMHDDNATMGSDLGRKHNRSQTSLSAKLNFLLAGTILGLCLYIQTNASILLGSSTAAATREGSSSCQVSFGSYRGHVYNSKESGTVGPPKCLVESTWMKVQQHKVQMPGSDTVIDDWLWIDYHDRINVLVEAEATPGQTEKMFLIFEQSKYALEGRTSKAIIGGIIEPHEEPKHAAAREVEEEMGVRCDNFQFLGRYRTDLNRGMGWVNSFLATNCSKNRSGGASHEQYKATAAEEVGAADTERQDLRTISLTELRQAARNGEFLEVQWSNTVALAPLALAEPG